MPSPPKNVSERMEMDWAKKNELSSPMNVYAENNIGFTFSSFLLHLSRETKAVAVPHSCSRQGKKITYVTLSMCVRLATRALCSSAGASGMFE